MPIRLHALTLLLVLFAPWCAAGAAGVADDLKRAGNDDKLLDAGIKLETVQSASRTSRRWRCSGPWANASSSSSSAIA